VKTVFYENIIRQAQALTRDVPHFIANLGNISALIYQEMENLNWAGFYIMENGMLVLGPFQGKPACIEIPVGRGVCGTAVAERCTQVVKNVHEFPGHIACDGASLSEIVVPIFVQNEVVGVLDIDSPLLARFDDDDQAGLEALVKVVEKIWPKE